MDKAPDFGSGDSRFESWQGQYLVFLHKIDFLNPLLNAHLLGVQGSRLCSSDVSSLPQCLHLYTHTHTLKVNVLYVAARR